MGQYCLTMWSLTIITTTLLLSLRSSNGGLITLDEQANSFIELNEKVLMKLEETVAGNRGLDSQMRNLLMTMWGLVLDTERELNQTKEEELIIKWKHAINFVKHDIFQLLEGGHEEDFFEEIEEIIEDDDVEDLTETFNYLREAAQNYLTGTVSSSDAGLITRRLAPCSVTALSGEVLRKFKETVAANRGLGSEMRNLLRDMRGRLLDTELEFNKIGWKWELLIVWNDAVYTVKNDVFDGDMTSGEIDFEEIEEIIEDEEVEDLTEAFKYLKDAVQNYLTGTSSSGEVVLMIKGRKSSTIVVMRIKTGNIGMCNMFNMF